MAKFVSKRRKTKSKTKQKPLDSKSINIKEKFAQQREAKLKRVKFAQLMGIAFFMGIVVGLPLGVIISPKVGIGACLGITVMTFSYQYPKTALWAFLIYLPFAGTITYWLAGGNLLFQVAKDAFYIPALLALIVDCRRQGKPIFVAKNLVPILSVLVIICILTLIFSNGGRQLLPNCVDLKVLDITGDCKERMPFLQGVLGLKILLGYIPLIFCAYYLIEDKKTLLRLGRLLVVLAIICCVLGLIQYWFLKTGRCAGTEGTGNSLFRASLEAKCFVGGSVLYTPEFGQIRLPGTFVSPWHWSWFLIANSAITFTVAFFETSFFWRIMGFIGLGLVFINAIICGQRIALAMIPAFILVMLIATKQIFRLKKFIPIGVGLAITLIFFISLNPEFVQQRINSLIGRWNNSPPHRLILEQFHWAVRNYPYYNVAGVLGAGLGRATNSTRSLGPLAFVETFHPKLIYEIGYIGFFTFMAFITQLTLYTFKLYKSLRDPVLSSFASAFWIFLLIIGYFPYWYPLDTDPVAIYYWLFAGVLIKLPVIDKQERQKEIEGIVKGNKIKGRTFRRLKKRQKAV